MSESEQLRDSIPTEAEISAPIKRRIKIFRNEDALDFQESGMMHSEYSPAAQEGIATLLDAGLDDGYIIKCLFRSPGADGFSLTYIWFRSNFPLPTHSHSTDCMYYVVSGELIMGKEALKSGDGFFVPGGCNYGYYAGKDGAEVLEFRDKSEFDAKYREGTPPMWARMAEICAANRDAWRNAELPQRKLNIS